MSQFLQVALPTSLHSLNIKAGTGEMKSFPWEEKDLNLHKSMGPKAMHARVLRDLADGTAEALSVWQSRQSCKAPRDSRKGNKASGIPYCTLSVLKADLLERLFTVSCSYKDRGQWF